MRKLFAILALVAVLFSASSCCQSKGAFMPKPNKAIRLVQYNVGVFNKSGSSSLSMVADMLKELQADVVALQEVDSCTTRTGQVDQLDSLCIYLGGWNGKYADAMPYKGGKYGVGVVSSPNFTPLASDVVRLPKGSGNEPRVVAVIEYENFVFASTHIDFGEENQLAQLRLLCAHFDSVAYQKPVFLLGDFNALPESKAIAYMLESWDMLSTLDFTFPAKGGDRCIDYIFARPGQAKFKVTDAKVCTEFMKGDVKIASDHLPLYVDIQFVQ